MNIPHSSSGFRISVAMCTYNGAKYLPEQLESILHQTLPVHELVISDDGSTDATLAIAQAFAERAPFPVKLLKNRQNLGSSKNFEQTISHCTGDLIALADQDDIWFDRKTIAFAQMFADDPSLGAVFGDATLIDARSIPVGTTLWKTYRFSREAQADLSEGRYARVLLKTPVVTGATLMFRSSLRNRILPIPSPWIHDAWIAWVIALESRIGTIKEPLMAYRTHVDQQIGVPAGTAETLCRFEWKCLWKPSTGKRLRTVQSYRNQVAELQQLAGQATQVSVPNHELFHQILVKQRFCQSVLNALTHSRSYRLFFSVRNAGNYFLFSITGWRAAMRDILL